MKTKTPILAAALSMSASIALSEGHAEYLNSGSVVPTNLPFSEMVIAGDTLYLAGQIGNIPGTLNLAEGGIEAESRQAMENIKTSLEAHGYSLANLVKCTVMLEEISEWGSFNAVYAEFFEAGKFPARAAFGADGLALGAKVEVDCIGAK